LVDIYFVDRVPRDAGLPQLIEAFSDEGMGVIGDVEESEIVFPLCEVL
tara:strand:- start:42871 stop:43014 length:144 start_codon:yes stop_codon:yes gene_type:complete